jgi:hypothetical protein
MSSIVISCIVFACIFAGTLAGMILRRFLPEHHLTSETKDVVKMGMGLVGTMTALVLGLLVASAKSSFDAQRSGLAQLSANIILLDRALAHYGPESKDARDTLRASIADLMQHTWPQEKPQSGQAEAKGTEGHYEGLYEQIQALSPKNDLQRALQAQALKSGIDIAQTRWLMFSQKGSSIPTPFLVVMVCWLALLLASFSLFAPSNATVFSTLLICSLSVSSAVFLILELDRPFDGMIQISSAPLQSALEKLGH